MFSCEHQRTRWKTEDTDHFIYRLGASGVVENEGAVVLYISSADVGPVSLVISPGILLSWIISNLLLKHRNMY